MKVGICPNQTFVDLNWLFLILIFFWEKCAKYLVLPLLIENFCFEVAQPVNYWGDSLVVSNPSPKIFKSNIHLFPDIFIQKLCNLISFWVERLWKLWGFLMIYRVTQWFLWNQTTLVPTNFKIFREAGVCCEPCNPSKWEADIWGWLEARRSAIPHYTVNQRPHWAYWQYSHTGGARGG